MRNSNIDTISVVAMLAVICLYTAPYKESDPLIWEIINQASGFAIPFFFIVAGYLFTKSHLAGIKLKELYTRYSLRMGVIFLAWSIIYFFNPRLTLISEYGFLNGFILSIKERLVWMTQHPIDFVFQGPSPHLWFFVSLILSITFLYLMLLIRKAGLIFLLAVPLYIFGLIAGAYSATPIGIDVGFNTRNGPFYSTLFVAIGWWLADRDFKPTLGLAYWTLISGIALLVTEDFFLHHLGFVSTTGYIGYNYLIGTVFFGTSFMLLALAQPELGKYAPVATLGRFTLGIYVSHILLVGPIDELIQYVPDLIGQLIKPVMIYMTAFLLVIILAKNKFIRPIVT